MPEFSQTADRALLFLEGLFIPVEIDIAAEVAAFPRGPLAVVSGPIQGLALIDTGTRLTRVRSQTLSDIGSVAVGAMKSDSAVGTTVQEVHYVSFSVPALRFHSDRLRVTDVELAGYGGAVVALIGRDLLSQWRLAWDGPAGSWSIEA